MVLLTDVYRNLTSLWIKPRECAFKQFKSPVLSVLRSYKNKGYFTWRPIHVFWSYLTQLFLQPEMFWTKDAEKIKTHILWSITFLLKNHAIYETMWKNILELGRPQMTIWRTCIACRILKATDTISEYVILIAFTQQQWLCSWWLHRAYWQSWFLYLCK